jgi:hypothetical protein
MLNENIARERVARGAAFLDDHVAGWREVANPDTLNLASCRDCVLAQLNRGGLLGQHLTDYDAFHNAVNTLGLDDQRAMELGFLVRDHSFTTHVEYALLTSAWRDELADNVPVPVPAPTEVLDEIERSVGVDWARFVRDYTVTTASFRTLNLGGSLAGVSVTR